MRPSFTVSKSTLLKPEFTFDKFMYKAGSSFIVSHEGSVFLLTAHHLFGPAAGLNKRYSSKELASLTPSVRAFLFDSGELHTESKQFIPLNDDTEYKRGDATQDLAIFKIDNTPLDSLTLAVTAPSKGDVVYLYARLKNDSVDDTLLHSATVTESSGKILEYRYHNRFLDPRARSGAPVLNQSGEVVGLNVTAAGVPIFNWKGRANPLSSIRHLLGVSL
ncbi:hypothetical protein A9Q99_19665 [Gammaproteobacteria bacterium 45_16_T64]|nr:hypothetical protein A9Q99_19665 [Gammaproteobacteria bacterium 45_16_T64]